MNREGTLLVADTGSTNGTYINGRRIAYGEARQVTDGDVVSFGDVEVRFKRR
jgi:pSer/pThr/pTyr-binding forkhead associated (FHA) protein